MRQSIAARAFDYAAQQAPTAHGKDDESNAAPALTTSWIIVAWPNHMRASSKGCTKADAGSSIDWASAFASIQEAPWTTTFEPS